MECENGLLTQRAGSDGRRGRPLHGVGGRIREQRNCLTRLALGGHKPEYFSFSAPVHQIWKVYVEALTGVSHAHCTYRLNAAFLAQGCVLAVISGSQEDKNSRGGAVWGTSHCQGPALRSASTHISLTTSLSASLEWSEEKKSWNQMDQVHVHIMSLSLGCPDRYNAGYL